MNSKLFNKLKTLADEIIVESRTSLTEGKRFKSNYVMFNASRGELDLDHLTYFPDGYFTGDDTTWDTFDEAEYFILDRYKKNYNSPNAMHIGFLETKTGKYWIVNDDGKLEQVNLDHAPKEPKIKKKDLPKQYKFDKSVPDEDLNKINAAIDRNKEKIKKLKIEINKYESMLGQYSDEPVLLSAVRRKLAELNKELEDANSFEDMIRRQFKVTKSMLNDARKRSKANNHEENNSELEEDFESEANANTLNKQEVLDWLSEHEIAWEDFINYFEDIYKSSSEVPMDEILSWVSEYDDLAEDFENKFGISVNADVYDDFSEEEIEEHLAIDAYDQLNSPNILEITPAKNAKLKESVEGKWNIGSNKLVSTDSQEYANLVDLAKLLQERSPNGYEYRVEKTYEDFGAGMQWYTIICDEKNGWGTHQVLNPAQWIYLANTGDVEGTYQDLIADKYFRDKLKTDRTASLFTYMNNLDD